jgi:hypothetical protein
MDTAGLTGLSTAALEQITLGQQQRTVLQKTNILYISKCRAMIKILKKFEDRQTDIFEFENNRPKEHTGLALGMFKLKLPITVVTAQHLFAAISIDTTLPKKRSIEQLELTENSNSLNPASHSVTVSAQTYQNYKSALKWWHEHHDPEGKSKVGVSWPAEVDFAISQQIRAYKRDVGIKKRNGIMKQKEGKSAYNLSGYIAICKYFNFSKPDGHSKPWMEGIFAQLFTKLSVNTIGRSDNIEDLLLSNIDWENDSMTIIFANTKSDVEGDVTADKKRIFANPFNAEICAILGLAIYTWCKCRVKKDMHLFDGTEQNKRYYRNLMRALQNIPEEVDMGCRRTDIGGHSNRKFAESTSVSKIDGPSRTMVCLRAGQSVGRTQDCYLKAEEDGDSLVGRTVAQLKFDADEFDVLPLHFSEATILDLNRYGWNKILPWYDELPNSFQRVIPKLFAALVYHFHNGDLRKMLHEEHPLFSQPIFTDPTLMNSLKDKVILTHYYCNDTRMSAQGVPGFIVVSREVRAVQKYLDEHAKLSLQHTSEIKEKLSEVITSLPQKIVETLQETIQINGLQPVTMQSMQKLVTDMIGSENGVLKGINLQLRDIFQRLDTIGGSKDGATDLNSAITNNDIQSTQKKVYTWPGYDSRFHAVPMGFTWPSGKPAKIIWDLWYFGTSSITGFRNITPKYDLIKKECRVRRARSATIIKVLTNIAITKKRSIQFKTLRKLIHKTFLVFVT